MKPKLFTWPCGAKFEARLTPSGRSLRYRRVDINARPWISAGLVKEAVRFAQGENPYGLDRWSERPKAPGGLYPSDTAAARRCVKRVLKYLGVL